MDIREGLAKRLCEWKFPESVAYWSWEEIKVDNEFHIPSTAQQFYDEADEILKYLHSQGVVIKKEGELPRDEHIELTCCSAYGRAQQDMLKAGYCKVEEL